MNKISPHDKVESKQSNCFSRNLTNFVQLPSTCTFKVLQWMLADWVAIVACVLVLISSLTNSEHCISLTTANVCCFVFLGISLSSSIIKLPKNCVKTRKSCHFVVQIKQLDSYCQWNAMGCQSDCSRFQTIEYASTGKCDYTYSTSRCYS